MTDVNEIVTQSTIVIKRATMARWNELNLIENGGPITLKDGEPAFETDTNRIKIGDGIQTWDQLPYIGIEAVIISEEEPELDEGQFWLSGHNEVLEKVLGSEEEPYNPVDMSDAMAYNVGSSNYTNLSQQAYEDGMGNLNGYVIGDDGAWEFQLPFPTKFIDQEYTSVFLNTNSSINFVGLESESWFWLDQYPGIGIMEQDRIVQGNVYFKYDENAWTIRYEGNALDWNWNTQSGQVGGPISWQITYYRDDPGIFHLSFDETLYGYSYMYGGADSDVYDDSFWEYQDQTQYKLQAEIVEPVPFSYKLQQWYNGEWHLVAPVLVNQNEPNGLEGQFWVSTSDDYVPEVNPSATFQSFDVEDMVGATQYTPQSPNYTSEYFWYDSPKGRLGRWEIQLPFLSDFGGQNYSKIQLSTRSILRMGEWASNTYYTSPMFLIESAGYSQWGNGSYLGVYFKYNSEKWTVRYEGVYDQATPQSTAQPNLIWQVTYFKNQPGKYYLTFISSAINNSSSLQLEGGTQTQIPITSANKQFLIETKHYDAIGSEFVLKQKYNDQWFTVAESKSPPGTAGGGTVDMEDIFLLMGA